MYHRLEGAFARGSVMLAAILAVVLLIMTQRPAWSDVFDISAQSLSTAIDSFCAVTGAEVYYDGAVARGLQSSSVSGNYASHIALKLLLTGTDLVPLRAGANAFLLVHPGAAAAQALAASKSAHDAIYRQYFAVVQQGVMQQLCRLSPESPLPDRMVIQLWIDQAGSVLRLEVDSESYVGPSANAVQATLQALRLPEAPPRNMPQPVTVALLSAKMAAARYCPPAPDMTVGR